MLMRYLRSSGLQFWMTAADPPDEARAIRGEVTNACPLPQHVIISDFGTQSGDSFPQACSMYPLAAI